MILHFEKTFHIEEDEMKEDEMKVNLSKSVIYYAKSAKSFTYDKFRFIDDIISFHEWIYIMYDHLLIKEYETMLIKT
jgi:hypothetical protein